MITETNESDQGRNSNGDPSYAITELEEQESLESESVKPELKEPDVKTELEEPDSLDPTNATASEDNKEEKKKKIPVADMELLVGALNTVTGHTLKFFRGKGFRKYNADLGAWMLLPSREEVLAIVCYVIRITPRLKGLNRLNHSRAWSSFLDWYSVAEAISSPPESESLLSFRNGTLDLRTMVLESHNPTKYCFQAVDSVFRFGRPTEVTMNYLFSLTSGDPLLLNLLREILFMILTGQKLQIIPYLYGPSGSGKSTFMNLLLALGLGNAIQMSLALWNTFSCPKS